MSEKITIEETNTVKIKTEQISAGADAGKAKKTAAAAGAKKRPRHDSDIYERTQSNNTISLLIKKWMKILDLKLTSKAKKELANIIDNFLNTCGASLGYLQGAITRNNLSKKYKRFTADQIILYVLNTFFLAEHNHLCQLYEFDSGVAGFFTKESMNMFFLTPELLLEQINAGAYGDAPPICRNFRLFDEKINVRVRVDRHNKSTVQEPFIISTNDFKRLFLSWIVRVFLQCIVNASQFIQRKKEIVGIADMLLILKSPEATLAKQYSPYSNFQDFHQKKSKSENSHGVPHKAKKARAVQKAH